MVKAGELLFLSKKDIEAILSPKEAIDICETTFKLINEGGVSQLFGNMLSVPGKGVFLPYPAVIESLGVAGIKWLSGFRANPSKGLPLFMATNILNDSETGAPIAIMEGMTITSMRTAGHAAVGAKYMAKKNSETIAIIGCGLEGRTHLRLMNELFNIKEVRACDLVEEARENFSKEMSEMLKVRVKATSSVEEAVKDADIVCEVSTAKQPIVMDEWLGPGCYLAGTNPIGVDPKFYSRADRWIVGHRERDLRWVEGPESSGFKYNKQCIHASLDEVVVGKKSGRDSDLERTLMTHHGMSALDVSCMYMVYKKAKEKGVGTILNLL